MREFTVISKRHGMHHSHTDSLRCQLRVRCVGRGLPLARRFSITALDIVCRKLPKEDVEMVKLVRASCLQHFGHIGEFFSFCFWQLF